MGCWLAVVHGTVQDEEMSEVIVVVVVGRVFGLLAVVVRLVVQRIERPFLSERILVTQSFGHLVIDGLPVESVGWTLQEQNQSFDTTWCQYESV